MAGHRPLGLGSVVAPGGCAKGPRGAGIVFELADNYCERVGAGLLAEPLNALTGFAFVLLGGWMLRRPAQPGLSRLMAMICLLTGLTTVLQHLHPSQATALVDIVPTVLFVGVTFFAYSRDVMRLSLGEAVSGTLVMLPFVGGSLLLLLTLEEPLASAGYASLPVFMLGMAVVLRQRDGGTGFRVMLAGVVLVGALALRGLDLPLCDRFPWGTHFLWHLGAAASIGMLICAYRRHLLAAGGGGR